MSSLEKAAELRRLHDAPELLVLVNVWDIASARLVAEHPGCRAIATASHAVAAVHGYADGEQIPRDTMIGAVEGIAAAVDLPVTADLEAGYGDAATTVRLAIAAGAVGGNLEDEMRPLPEAVDAVAAAIDAGSQAGVPFVVNARTDAYLEGTDREPAAVFDDAVERGRAFLDAGADCVFVPGVHDAETIGRLVEEIGDRKVSVLAGPDSPPLPELHRLGVARVSYGPWPHLAALAALADYTAARLD